MLCKVNVLGEKSGVKMDDNHWKKALASSGPILVRKYNLKNNSRACVSATQHEGTHAPESRRLVALKCTFNALKKSNLSHLYENGPHLVGSLVVWHTIYSDVAAIGEVEGN